MLNLMQWLVTGIMTLTHLDFFNILPNPDKFDDKDPDNMLNCPHSNYYSLIRVNQFFDNTMSKCLSMLHCILSTVNLIS